MEGPLTEARWTAERSGDPAAPVICVFIHGGFWRARFAADSIAPLAAACAGADFQPWVWNIEYPRVAMPGGGWPGTARSVGGAVAAAVRAAAGRPVALIGHSAGGHLALWAAREHPVALTVSLAGVCDLRAAARDRLGNGAVAEFLGREPTADLLAAASPAARLPLGVPALLIHGDADDNVPIDQSRSFRAAATAAGDDCELVELPDGDHFDVIDPEGRAWPVLRARLERLAGGGDGGARRQGR
ncbi:MAG TPA: prolyl oligopeptidase family serine peptidase [Solirubrobacteraceae bacterium]|nr:prolyl oligopeptidase family serine peptidase [Solirubrobacteraceae bacterium]